MKIVQEEQNRASLHSIGMFDSQLVIFQNLTTREVYEYTKVRTLRPILTYTQIERRES